VSCVAWCAAACRHAPPALARARHPPQATPLPSPPPPAPTAIPAAARMPSIAGHPPQATPLRPHAEHSWPPRPHPQKVGGASEGRRVRGGERGVARQGRRGRGWRGWGGKRPRMMRNGSDTLDPPGRTPPRGAEKDIAISFQAESGRPTPARARAPPPSTSPSSPRR